MEALFWGLGDLLSLVLLSFFSMFEMAAISFDRFKVDYYVARGYKRIKWLKQLLDRPSYLFGTTLVGVSLSLVVGSECARNFFSSIGLDPDLAPFAQVILAIVLGELAPMFAARTHPEHVVFLGMPIAYFTYKLLFPFLFLVNKLTRFCNWLIGYRSSEGGTFIPREELVKLLEAHEVGSWERLEESSNLVLSRIFSMGEKKISSILKGLDLLPTLSSEAVVRDLRKKLRDTDKKFFQIIDSKSDEFLGLVSTKDLLKASDNQKITHFLKESILIDQEKSLLELLNFFRREDEDILICVDGFGLKTGFITFQDLLEFFFRSSKEPKIAHQVFIDRTFSGEATIGEVAEALNYPINGSQEMTLRDFLEEEFGTHGEVGQRRFYENLEWIIESRSLMQIEKVRVKNQS